MPPYYSGLGQRYKRNLATTRLRAAQDSRKKRSPEMDERSALMRSIEPIGDMILVMGVTGAGKSYFINCLAGEGSAEEYHGLQSGKPSVSFVGRFAYRL